MTQSTTTPSTTTPSTTTPSTTTPSTTTPSTTTPSTTSSGAAPSLIMFGVADLDAANALSTVHGRVEALVGAGATVQRPTSDVGGGKRVAVLPDADGNVIGLREA